MFKSKFASALSTMMAGAMGMAIAERKLSVGYGAEAGSMTPTLKEFVRDVCKGSLVLCRNEPSREVLHELGIRTTSGADTAWTFEPAPLSRGAQLLRDAGWDGRQKILVVCPINPFWWPVKPDLLKAAAHTLGGQYKHEHYRRSTSTTTATRPPASTTPTCRPSPTRSTPSPRSRTSSPSWSAWSSSIATPART
jgi:hypothetical protein